MYLDELAIEINYPHELQLLEKSIVKKCKQSKYETVVIDRNKVESFVSVVDNKTTKIVYTDNGKTLYWVPWNYSGKFVVNGEVTDIDKYAFQGDSKITDIVLPEGLTEIGEWTFNKCEKLKKIIIPSTVKK